MAYALVCERYALGASAADFMALCAVVSRGATLCIGAGVGAFDVANSDRLTGDAAWQPLGVVGGEQFA